MRNEGIGSWPPRRARMTPHRTAIVYEDHAWTYAELAERVNRLANALRALGIQRGDRVAYLGRNHPTLAEKVFACGLLGAVFVPLNTRLAGPELAAILADSGAETLIVAPDLADTYSFLSKEIPRFITLDTYEELLADASPEPIDEDVPLEALCMLQYTSGTSGQPKGVMLTHGNITWNCFNLLLDVDVAADEVSLVSAPLFHTAALNQLFLPTFLKGGTAVLTASFSPDEAFDLIERHRVTWMFGVPAMFLAMVRSPRWADADLSSVRTLMCGGAPVPETLIRAYQERGLTFLQGYGLTETSPGALFLRAADSVRKAGSAGTPCFFTDVRVVGASQADVPPGSGEVGEVLVRGPNVSPGYWQAPGATAAAFQDGWLRTGDAATVDAEGYVTIADRIKDMFVTGGENVYPAEVEHALYQHPAVAECAVIGVPDEHWGEVGRAVVVLRPDATVTPEALLESLSGRLAAYKIPKSVVFTDALPRNAAGKLVKARLRETLGGTA